MSDEAKKPDETGEWQMPEPVFRSSEGHTPKALDDDDDPTIAPDSSEPAQSVRVKEKFKVRHQKKKKRGCLSSIALTIVILIGSVALIIATVIYVIFYSRSGWIF